MLLLLAAVVRARRAARHESAFLRRPGAAELSRSADSCLHVLRCPEPAQTSCHHGGLMSQTQSQSDSSKYYLPHNSPWPIFAAVSLFVLMAGSAAYLNDWVGAYAFLPGAILMATML